MTPMLPNNPDHLLNMMKRVSADITCDTDGELVNEQVGPYGATFVGNWDNKTWYAPIVERWAYMEYESKTPLRDLLEKKQTIFTR